MKLTQLLARVFWFAVGAAVAFTAVPVAAQIMRFADGTIGTKVALYGSNGVEVTSFGGGTQYTHDAALTVGTTVGTMAMGRASAAAPTDVSADNDAVLPWYLRSGSPVVNLAMGGTLIAPGTGLQVDLVAGDTLATVTTVGTVTTVSTLSTITNNVPTNIVQVGGATQSATNPLFVRLTDGSAAIAPSTQLQENVAVTLANITGGAQFGIGVSAEQTVVTNGRPAIASYDLVGKQIVLPYANPENFVSGTITSAMTGTTSTSLVASPGGSLRNYLTQCTFSNSHATVGTDILIQDGSGGTTLYVVPLAPAFGGATITFPTPLRQPTTATAIYVANVTTGSNTKASCSGYKGL